MVHTGGSYSSLYSKIEVSTASILAIHETAKVEYTKNGNTVVSGPFTVYSISTVVATSMIMNPTYSQFRTTILNDYPNADIPSYGHFKQCSYTDKINYQAVVSNALEMFP